MLSITYRKFGIRLTHIYFADDREIHCNTYRNEVGDIIFLHGVKIEPTYRLQAA